MVLLVDDDQAYGDVLRLLFDLRDAPFTWLGDGRFALDMVERLRPVVVLLDVMMPDKDGLAVLSEIRGHDDGRVAATPVVMFTALRDRDFEETAWGLGADDYVPKGSTFSDVWSRVEPYVARESRLRR